MKICLIMAGQGFVRGVVDKGRGRDLWICVFAAGPKGICPTVYGTCSIYSRQVHKGACQAHNKEKCLARKLPQGQ